MQSLSVIQFDCLEDSEGDLRPWQDFIDLPETETEEEKTDQSDDELEDQVEAEAGEESSDDNET